MGTFIEKMLETLGLLWCFLGDMKRFSCLFIAAVGFGLLATPEAAQAGWGWGGPRVCVGVGFYGPGPYCYAPYGYGPYYYAPPVVVTSRAAYAEEGSVEIDVQRALVHTGYYSGPVDGAVGPQTRAAIRAYQADRGLPVTGRIDGSLLRSLHL
jgi:hypothetical protein